ncbi:MAG: cation-translocating P-type ATPase, partial [Zoogloea sp.]|nr:cation-translocating P-type ATPase [Zoogloea sp.]
GSPLVFRVERVGEATRLAAIRHLMERAATEKPRVVEQSDRFAAWFILALLLLAVVTAGVWYFVDPGRALWVFVSVLVVSCPCALSLATPVALTVATDALARAGVLVTRGHAVEALAKVDVFAFDKTGTLTWGRMQLAHTVSLAGIDDLHALALAAALEQGSEHAVAAGLRRAAERLAVPAVAEVAAVTGQGVSGRVGGEIYRLGRKEFVAELVGQAMPAELEAACAAGGTVVVLGASGRWLAAFVLADVLRDDAAALVRELHADGRACAILSGDSQQAVDHVAAEVGVEDARGGLTPQGKHAALQSMQAGGKVVAMVGDGVNDAPVLALAQVSVAMHSGTDLARNQADIVLLGERLEALGQGLRIARRTLSIIRQNLAWSFIYNFTAVPLAMFGLVTPWMAGIGMSASSLLVVLNALRLQSRGIVPKGR